MAKFNFTSVNNTQLNLILGLGETGIAAANWCIANGSRLNLLDTRADAASKAAVQALGPVNKTSFGPAALADATNLKDVNAIVLSPGLNPHEPELAAFLTQAKAQNIEIIGEIELFARALADLSRQGYKPLVFAVTGTNGKTTVTSLLGHLVKACGLSVRVAGNIGPAALSSLLEAVNNDDLPQAWVLELSSFQLYTTTSLQPDAAVVLNLSQDHLDWHGSMANYAAAKAKLLQLAKCAVVNRDDSYVLAMADTLQDKVVHSFGFNKPAAKGDFGVQIQADMVWLAQVIEQDGAATGSQNVVVQNLMPAAALQLLGKHNVLNVLAALCLTQAAALPLAQVLHELRLYKGEPHRTELVRSIKGVDFIDDSKGTNIGATIAALQGIEQPIILIAGGLGKGQDFSILAPVITQHVKAVYLLGQDASLIAQAVATSGVPQTIVPTLEQAVEQAFIGAKPGDAILLSPACASMDMFKNYIHRGQCFVAAVNELALDQGEVA